MNYGKPHGKCAKCERFIPLRRDGTVGYHRNIARKPALKPCTGWTKEPKDPFA